MKKKIKKSAKAVVHDSCTLFLLPQLFAGVRKLREVVFCEKFSFMRSYHSLRSLEVKANNFGGNV